MSHAVSPFTSAQMDHLFTWYFDEENSAVEHGNYFATEYDERFKALFPANHRMAYLVLCRGGNSKIRTAFPPIGEDHPLTFPEFVELVGIFHHKPTGGALGRHPTLRKQDLFGKGTEELDGVLASANVRANFCPADGSQPVCCGCGTVTIVPNPFDTSFSGDWSILHWAVWEKDENAIVRLVKAGCSPDVVFTYTTGDNMFAYFTPLDLARYKIRTGSSFSKEALDALATTDVVNAGKVLSRITEERQANTVRAAEDLETRAAARKVAQCYLDRRKELVAFFQLHQPQSGPDFESFVNAQLEAYPFVFVVESIKARFPAVPLPPAWQQHIDCGLGAEKEPPEVAALIQEKIVTSSSFSGAPSSIVMARGSGNERSIVVDESASRASPSFGEEIARSAAKGAAKETGRQLVSMFF